MGRGHARTPHGLDLFQGGCRWRVTLRWVLPQSQQVPSRTAGPMLLDVPHAICEPRECFDLKVEVVERVGVRARLSNSRLSCTKHTLLVSGCPTLHFRLALSVPHHHAHEQVMRLWENTELLRDPGVQLYGKFASLARRAWLSVRPRTCTKPRHGQAPCLTLVLPTASFGSDSPPRAVTGLSGRKRIFF